MQQKGLDTKHGESATRAASTETQATAVKKRGRPRKTTTEPDAREGPDVQKMLSGLRRSEGGETGSSGVGAKRPRGRPRIHPVEELKVKRPRGRPRKDASTDGVAKVDVMEHKQDEAESAAASATGEPVLVKRGPGRPRKVPVELEAGAAGTPVKRKPGRPRKTPTEQSGGGSDSSPKRGPGRPRKRIISIELENPASAKRGPGRPRKSAGLPVSAENASHNTEVTEGAEMNDSVVVSQLLPQPEMGTKGVSATHHSVITVPALAHPVASYEAGPPSTLAKRYPNSSAYLSSDRSFDPDSERLKNHSNPDDLSKDSIEVPVRGYDHGSSRSPSNRPVLVSSPTKVRTLGAYSHSNLRTRETLDAQRHKRDSAENSDIEDLRSSITTLPDDSDYDSRSSDSEPTFSRRGNVMQPRASSSTSNEGIIVQSSKEISARPHETTTQENTTQSPRRKRRLKKTMTVTLADDLSKGEENNQEHHSFQSENRKSVVLNFNKKKQSPSPVASCRGNHKNNILDDSYDVFEFSSHGNSAFVIPPDAFKSPQRDSKEPSAPRVKKSVGILGILKNTTQSLQAISKSPRHSSINKLRSKLDEIDIDIQLSDDEDDEDDEQNSVRSTYSTPLCSPRCSPKLRPRQQLHNFVIDDVSERNSKSPPETPLPQSPTRTSKHASQLITGAHVTPAAVSSPKIGTLYTEQNILALDRLQLGDHGTPQNHTSHRNSELELEPEHPPSRNSTPEPINELPVWRALPNIEFNKLDEDRRMLSGFLHDLLRYMNVNEATLKRDIDGNITYFIQQMPNQELDMTFIQWLDLKVSQLKVEYLKELEKKRTLLVGQFEASERIIRNISDSKVLLELANRFGIKF
ncbi:AER399Cp [Eremothecium gossypii ATCC 10895]|uniref:AER399Cp n=1 Tax=Eremothecium gossypii (strain ATCC 10895 / CBS 109.51 / FGSC 9923 / NRRL Y-1056) TaxID=284811 RepID=Q755W9_EREGS|nr:AER399Cp [Eremothecium gossypii ATCC 10895]AAS53078.2 AER399Cp [Eremothecium gossypii ATCC 10895]AEY97387.1 FAER399Cp [Eremothecium gossypii FDAG1]